jgi:hypothetical protein
MNDREQFSALIADIYDAALDPAQRTGHSGGPLSKHSLGTSENLYCSLQVYSESVDHLEVEHLRYLPSAFERISTRDFDFHRFP